MGTAISFDREREWLELKQKKDMLDPLTAFAGFGCSYGGMWFGSYAQDKQQTNYATLARNALLDKKSGFSGIIWTACDYKTINIPDKAVVYCDPPYINTAGYTAVDSFNHPVFWDWVRDLGKRATVFVSEYEAPADINKVFSITKLLGLHPKEGNTREREECLFTPNDITDIQLRKTKPVGFISRRASI